MRGLLWTAGTEAGRTYLDTIGDTTAQAWSFTSPGGPRALTATLALDLTRSNEALMPGRRCGVTVGGHDVWTGRLLQPTPTEGGFALAAVGDAARLDELYAVAPNAYDLPAVFARDGLDVLLRDGGGSPAISADSGSVTIAQALNDVAADLGLTWNLRDAGVYVEPLPTTSAGLLLAPDDAGARTLADFASTLVVVYTETGTGLRRVAVYDNEPTLSRFGRVEKQLDLTGKGATYTEAQALTIAATTLGRMSPRARFTGSFALAPGDLLTVGQAPVDLASFRAGDRLEVLLLDVSRGGDAVGTVFPIVVGEYAYDDTSGTAQVTPSESTRNSLTALLERAAA